MSNNWVCLCPDLFVFFKYSASLTGWVIICSWSCRYAACQQEVAKQLFSFAPEPEDSTGCVGSFTFCFFFFFIKQLLRVPAVDEWLFYAVQCKMLAGISLCINLD